MIVGRRTKAAMIRKQAIVPFLLCGWIAPSRCASRCASTVPSFFFPGKKKISSLRRAGRLRGGDAGDDAVGDEKGSKTPEQIEFLRSLIRHNVFNGELPPSSIDVLVRSFERAEYARGSVIIRQGDDGADFLLVLEDGECTISIDGKELPHPYGTVGRGTVLGEDALIYQKERAATVVAKTDVSAWRLPLEAFQYFMNVVQTKEEDVEAKLLEIDRVIDRISGLKTSYGGDVISRFQPARGWLWGQWRGTILQHVWKSSVLNMLVTTGFLLCTRLRSKPSWAVGMLPTKSDPVISRILGLGLAWKYTMSIATFMLVFFVTQAYNLWREVYATARVVQGRLNDINLLVAFSADREKGNGNYTAQATEVLEDVASYTRLFHAFTWASLSKKMNALRSVLGMRRLTSRGYMTAKQCDILGGLESHVQPQHAVLMWIVARISKGMKDGAVDDDQELRSQIYSKATQLQGTFAGIGGKLAGRMPLAYAHFVQVLVDAFLILAPFALYGELGIWSIPAVGILTFFYSGLLDLAKILLDPLDNDDFYNDNSVNMDLAVIIRESNAGSTRWMSGGQHLPF